MCWRYNSSVLAALALCVIAVVVWLSAGKNKVSSHDVIALKAEVLANQNGIRISGLVLHSAFAVKQIRMAVGNKSIDVDLVISSGDAAPSGSFEFVVYTRPETEMVRFGTDRVVVWRKLEVPAHSLER